MLNGLTANAFQRGRDIGGTIKPVAVVANTHMIFGRAGEASRTVNLFVMGLDGCSVYGEGPDKRALAAHLTDPHCEHVPKVVDDNAAMFLPDGTACITR